MPTNWKHILTLAQSRQRLLVDPKSLLRNVRWEKQWCGNPNSQEGEGIYYRYIEHSKTHERCLQTIVFYRKQWIPYHKHDFAPVYFYFDPKDQLVRVFIDSGHHKVASISGASLNDLRVIVYAPWHAFRINQTHWMQSQFKNSFFPLDDDQIKKWWFCDGAAQLKLRSKLIDPWHPNLSPENVHYPATFRDEAPCPVCGNVFHIDDMERNDTIFSLTIRCPKNHTYSIHYDTQKHSADITTL